MLEKFTIGLDYGTLSARAVVIDISSGREVGHSTFQYPHGVMSEYLPGSISRFPSDWALQHPSDYLQALCVVKDALAESGVAPCDVIGLGIDFTACTLMPTLADSTPLCFLRKFENRPHAYVKLWKHHAAQPWAARLNAIASDRNEAWLAHYGGKISSEWVVPKIWQVLDEDSEIYHNTDRFIEAGDWVVWMLTGILTRNACAAGYKAIWNKQSGFPSREFFAALDPELVSLPEEKLAGTFLTAGKVAGYLTDEAASLTGLNPGTPVAAANVDAHVCVPAAGISRPNAMLAIIGTSTCHMMLSKENKVVPGICGAVEDGILQGYIGYESGQSCVGDHFAWLVNNCLPKSYYEKNKKKGEDVYALLDHDASKLIPGKSGLLALDWFNGNRSVLVDADLAGLIVGLTLQTTTAEIYRALIEATAFGTRTIIENYISNGVPVDELLVSGGIPWKNPLAMQIYSDVTGLKVVVVRNRNGPAFGSAIMAAVAAGRSANGYESIESAMAMVEPSDICYLPNSTHKSIYDSLYCEYMTLHNYFGRGQNDVMKRLKQIKRSAFNA